MGALIGMAMWGIRFILFILAAKGHHWMAFVGIGLHGICNDFFNCECNVYRPFSTS